ncbi:MAG: Rieske 2Fe-2S domain-containing protein [Lautropia sp.]
MKEKRAEQFKRLTQCGPDTDMGRLLRLFWHPVGLSRELAKGKAKPVRILGEDLTLYRGESGRAHLVGGFCRHRRTRLHTGWVQGERIRCAYHGWQYDGTGRCTERPAERGEVPAGCRIPGYPTNEYCGFIFAYLGEGEAPAFELPRKDPYEEPNVIIAALHETWNINWFQMVENQQDGVHISFLHKTLREGSFINMVTDTIPTLEHTETDCGIEQKAIRSENNIRIGNWTFPNNSHVMVPGLTQADPWMNSGLWVVPSSDRTTERFTIYSLSTEDQAARERFLAYFEKFGNPIYQSAEHHDELMLHGEGPSEEDSLFGLIPAQDYLGIAGQGVVADRENEMLGRSDAGIVMLRRIFWREMDALKDGRPTKRWKRRENLAPLPTQPGRAYAD